MGKYLNRPTLTPQQEAEIFPLLDAALKLPFGKAIVHQCPKSRAAYLYRILNGERYRNAIQSISTYLPQEPLYGKGLYYNLIIETFNKGILIANAENPPPSVTWAIITCAATRKPVDISEYNLRTVASRLNKLRERHEELRPIYIDNAQLRWATPAPEELIIVDVDTGIGHVATPTREQRAKVR